MRLLARSAVVLLAFGLAIGTLPALARPEPRTHTEAYEFVGAHGMRYSHFWDAYLEELPEREPLVFHPKARDRYVALELADASGENMYVRVQQPTADGEEGIDDYFCGQRAIYKLTSTEPMTVRIYEGLCPNHLVGRATTGTITATFATHAVWALPTNTHEH